MNNPPQHRAFCELGSSTGSTAQTVCGFPCITLEVLSSFHLEIGEDEEEIHLFFPPLPALPVASEVCLSEAADAQSSWDLIRKAL